ncbi:MAG: hypothetical protein Q8N23_36510 [Archangium sp.]|nr:hypothetical protein [Archangium sp.]MDP3158233.1 hypothetical protein [Archangium sp.]MDP3572478.1 hypothetical protein [Archangium sp.]
MRRKMARIAVVLWVVAGLVSLAGWTSSLSALSFTYAPDEEIAYAMMKSGVVLVAWFGAVMVAPVMMLTAMTWSLINLALRKRGEVGPEGTG